MWLYGFLKRIDAIRRVEPHQNRQPNAVHRIFCALGQFGLRERMDMRRDVGVAMLHEDLNHLAKPVRAGRFILVVPKPPFARI